MAVSPTLTHHSYNYHLLAACKRLNGSWNASVKRWTFPPHAAPEVEILNLNYNTNPVTIEITAKHELRVECEPVTCLGYTIARAFSNTTGCKLGENVLHLSGQTASTGTKRRFYSIINEGARFRLQVPQHVLDLFWKYEVDDWYIDRLDGEPIPKNAESAPRPTEAAKEPTDVHS